MKYSIKLYQRLRTPLLASALVAVAAMALLQTKVIKPVAVVITDPDSIIFEGLYEVFSPFCSDTAHLIRIAPMGSGDWCWINNFNGSDTTRVFCRIDEQMLYIPIQAVNIDGNEVMISGGGFRSGETIDLFYVFKPFENDYVNECHFSGRALQADQLFAYRERIVETTD